MMLLPVLPRLSKAKESVEDDFICCLTCSLFAKMAGFAAGVFLLEVDSRDIL